MIVFHAVRGAVNVGVQLGGLTLPTAARLNLFVTQAVSALLPCQDLAAS